MNVRIRQIVRLTTGPGKLKLPSNTARRRWLDRTILLALGSRTDSDVRSSGLRGRARLRLAVSGCTLGCPTGAVFASLAGRALADLLIAWCVLDARGRRGVVMGARSMLRPG